MRVVHIGYIFGEKNTGGAAIAATRLHKALLTHGVDSYYVCVRKMEDGENVYELPIGWKRKMFLFLTKVTRCVWKFSPYRKSICMNFIPLFGLESLLSALKPDVVHVHWLNADVASFEQIAKLPYKFVFNLHDLFVINALSPHPAEDRRFIEGFNRLNSSWMERYFFERKKYMISQVNATFVGPSRWVCEQCKASVIGQHRNVCEVSNLVSPEYANINVAERRSNNQKFIILFGAQGGRGNVYKGFSELVLALRLLPEKIKEQCQLQIYGEDAEECLTVGIKTVFLGVIESISQMIEILNKADVFVFPSIAETQGMSKVEAMICGLPVIAFNRTACSEGIEHGVSGWIAKDGDHCAYARGIEYFWRLWQSGMLPEARSRISAEAKTMFSQEIILDRISEVYQEVLAV